MSLAVELLLDAGKDLAELLHKGGRCGVSGGVAGGGVGRRVDVIGPNTERLPTQEALIRADF